MRSCNDIKKYKFYACIYRCILHVKLCGSLHGKRLKGVEGGGLLSSDMALKL